MNNYITESKVEAYFQSLDSTFNDNKNVCKIPVITTSNYIILGQFTALRFLEWVSLNPTGVVALPTGKTPEFFIKWAMYYLEHWDEECEHGILKEIGINCKKPVFDGLHLFQMDEFFPINPEHERAFRYFIQNYYIKLFGFDPKKTHLINTYFLNEEEQRLLGGAKNLGEVFADGNIDLSLRIKPATNKDDEIKQTAIRLFDNFCMRYERSIRDLGGIGFFLSGVGSDGHIALNVRGSSPFSHTRLTGINYETQASSASDMGGIELVRKKAVITIGLETITYNPSCVAIIMAAGQGKSDVVAGSVLNDLTQEYPATVLQKLPAARFFVTESSGSMLPKSHHRLAEIYPTVDNKEAFIENIVLQDAYKSNKTLQQLIAENHQSDELKFAESLSHKSSKELLSEAFQSIEKKIVKGLQIPENQTILHTGPHHDDIELAYFPHLHHLVRSTSISNHFVYCTSGYTSVTSNYLKSCYTNIANRINTTILSLKDQKIDTLFDTDYQNDITLYLRGIANQEQSVQDFAVARRLARKWVQYNNYTTIDELNSFILDQIAKINAIEAGRKEPDEFHRAKGWLREFEAELVWAHFGLNCDHVNHLRLPFYSDDIFPHYPDPEKDIKPIVNLLERIKPTIISLALDPEGSGPDTHFKTLIALSQAIDIYHNAHPEIDLHVWGYRNVWSEFNISEVNTMIPISLNSFAVIKSMFNTCYLSQRSADFPSPQLDGAFTEVAQINWVNQHNDVCKLLGEDYFYESDKQMLRRTYGFIYLKDMTYDEFKRYMIPVKSLLETKQAMQ